MSVKVSRSRMNERSERSRLSLSGWGLQVEEAAQARTAAESERGEATARGARVEDRAQTVEAERDRLAEQVQALIARIPEPEA